jgi:hypothetical protein
MKKTLFGWKVKELPSKTCEIVTYIYNSRKYTYVTYDDFYDWPPPTSKEPVFAMAIKCVTGSDGTDYTDTVKRLAGPRGDYHGQRIKVGDIVGDVTLKIENILGMKTTLNPSNFF